MQTWQIDSMLKLKSNIFYPCIDKLNYAPESSLFRIYSKLKNYILIWELSSMCLFGVFFLLLIREVWKK